MQSFASGYANVSKTYSDAAAVSAGDAQSNVQSAQQQAETAQQASAQVQQKVNAFSGYTKEEIDNGFAAALIGEESGQSITLDDVQPGTNLRSLLVTGQKLETGTGDRSLGHPYQICGTGNIQAASGKNLFRPQPGSITINGVTCTVAEDGTILLNGTAAASVNIELNPLHSGLT